LDNLKINEKIFEQQVPFQTVTADGENNSDSATLQTEYKALHYCESAPSGCDGR
jgi:hypothetical protein